MTKKEKEFGPPVKSLYDYSEFTIPSPEQKPIIPLDESSNTSSFVTPQNFPIRSAVSTAPNQSLFKDIHDTSKEHFEFGDETIVTVFGFPISSTNLIFREFQKYGQIIQYKIGQGNWIHIQYQTKLQAQKALSKNGTIIDQGLMIGVIPCQEKLSQIQVSVPSTPIATTFRPSSNNYAVEYSIPKTTPVAENSWWAKVNQYIFGN